MNIESCCLKKVFFWPFVIVVKKTRCLYFIKSRFPMDQWTSACALVKCVHKVSKSFCNKLLTICNKLNGTMRRVMRLFQQGWDSHDKTVFLQPCFVNFVTTLLPQDRFRGSEQPIVPLTHYRWSREPMLDLPARWR